MRLVLLGPPGAGKGTQAEVLSAEYKLPHISTGDILREEVREKSDVGIEAKSYMDKGGLVPDSIVTKIVVKRLGRPDATNGFILDGYPRTKTQSISLSSALDENGISIDRVLYFKTSVPTVIARLSGRRVCDNCKAIYHTKNNPPSKEGICDRCGGGLKQRRDDNEETVKKRLKVYEETASDLLGYYKEKGLLMEISGDLEVDKLFRSLKETFVKEGLV
jgi:adenylate kinase